jgi:hypothetical protein
MSRAATFGLLAGMIGSALYFLFWNRTSSSSPARTPQRPRGEVIFRNTPTAGGEL